QRDDPFYVDLGSIFDLAGLRPFNPFHLIPLPAAAGVDGLKNYNTHSIVLRVPISQLVQAPSTTVGIYASASREQKTILKADGTKDGHGPWTQVSRLGNPLINEVVIPLGDKDYWNREDPGDDSQFAHYYTTPEVSHLENVLYGAPPQGHAGGARADRRDRALGPLHDSAHRRPGPELHGHRAGRPPAAEHRDQARRPGRLPRRHGEQHRARPDGR